MGGYSAQNTGTGLPPSLSSDSESSVNVFDAETYAPALVAIAFGASAALAWFCWFC